MRINFTTGVHGDLSVLDIYSNFLKKNKPDIVLIGGDFLAPILDGEGERSLALATQSLMNIKVQNEKLKNDSLEDVANKLIGLDKCSDELRERAKIYSVTLNIFREKAWKQYENLEKIFDGYEFPIGIAPGRWDIKDIDIYLGKYNMHNKPSKEIDDVKFASHSIPSNMMLGIPSDLYLSFNNLEMYDFLVKENPDVALLYTPPYDLCDLDGNDVKGGNSVSALAYILAREPSVVLVNHPEFGVAKVKRNNTIVISSGNLGRYKFDPNCAFGNFVEFEIGNEGGENEGKIHWLNAFRINLDSGKSDMEQIATYKLRDDRLKLIKF